MDDQQIAELTARLTDLESKVDWLYRNAAYSYAKSDAPAVVPDGVSAEVLDLVRSGRPIQAIKLYRQQTGVGLEQAKDVIDGLR